MTKEQLLEKIEHIKDVIQTYPDDTEILGIDINGCLGTSNIHVYNNIDKIAVKNNATTVARLLVRNAEDNNDTWREHDIAHANGVYTFSLERLPGEGATAE